MKCVALGLNPNQYCVPEVTATDNDEVNHPKVVVIVPQAESFRANLVEGPESSEYNATHKLAVPVFITPYAEIESKVPSLAGVE